MEEDWEVVSQGSQGSSSVDWEEISRSRSASHSRSSSPTPSTLERQLKDANERASLAELRAQDAEAQARALRSQLALAHSQSRDLQLVVLQQRAENNQLTAALLMSGASPRHVASLSSSSSSSSALVGVKSCKEKRSKERKMSKAVQHVAPQNVTLPKRRAWGKANHRTSITSARFI